jgi:hypothetical protein
MDEIIFFKKPEWLKPEINNLWYYVHLLVLAVVVLGLLQLFVGGRMLTISNVLWSIPLLLLGDIAAHSILGMD